MRYFDHKKLPLSIAGILLVASASTVLAQTEEQGVRLEEIIVTAQKRQQSVNDIGLSVQVMDANFLKSRNITSLESLTQAVPSMTYAETQSGAPTITLRGIGFNETSLAAFPAVSMYLDEVPLTFPVMANHTNYDLERVEVLQGPQGTVFGQNVTGGAVNFIAAKPTQEFEAGVMAGYGRFNTFEAEGYVSGAVSDTVAVRLSGRAENADGWQQSMTRSEKNGEKDSFAGRLILDFTPSDDTFFRLNINGWKDEGESIAPQLIGTNVQSPGFLYPEVANAPLAPSDPRAADWTPGLPAKDNTFFQVSLRGEFQLMDSYTLTSLTSYSDYDQKERNDFDGVPVASEDFAANNGQIEDFAQELRLESGQDQKLRWMVGANYQKSSVDQQFRYVWDYASTSAFVETLGYPAIENWFGTDQEMETWAVFANTEFDVSETVTLKAGIRYTDFENETSNCGTDLLPPYYVGNLFYNVFAGGAAGPYSPGLCFSINDLGETVNGVPPFFPGRFEGKFKEDNTPWRIGIDWTPNSDTLVYANITKGYKAGNFPTIGGSVWSQYAPVTQESVLSYEIGSKLTALDQRLQLNGAVFYYEYDDKQLRSRTIDPVWGNLDVVQNIPESSATGVELSLLAVPADYLTVGINATYIDATIDEFTGISASGVVADFGDTDMPFTPEFSMGANADLVVPMNSGFNFIAGASVYYTSSTYSIIGGKTNPPLAQPQDKELFKIDSYTLMDMYAGVESENWRITAWAKNLTDEYYWSNVVPAFDTLIRYAGMTRTYGVRVSYDF
jgi:outer membrane receptor protein involved in Fe transport